MSRTMLIGAVALASLLSTVTPGAAQTPPLPPGSSVAVLEGKEPGDEPAPPRVARAIVQALEMVGMKPIAPEETTQRLSNHDRALCRGIIRCDEKALRSALHVDAVLRFFYWRHAGAPDELALKLVRKEGVGIARKSLKKDQRARDVAQGLVAMALKQAEKRPHIEVRFAANAPDTMLEIDRLHQISPPASLSLAPGNHMIMASAPGHVSRTYFIGVPEQAESFTHRVELEVYEEGEDGPASEASAQGASQTQPDQRAMAPSRPSPVRAADTRTAWDRWLGIGGLAVGVPLLVYGVSGLIAGASNHCVKESAAGRCQEHNTTGVGPWLATGVGAVAAGGGSFMLVVRPFEAAATASPAATLELKGQF